jgi:hypothetical protein
MKMIANLREEPRDLARHLGVAFIQYGATRDWILPARSLAKDAQLSIRALVP